MTLSINRRKVLMSTLFGAGYVGLRALATGIPAAILMKGSRAFADGTVSCSSTVKTKAQYFVMATSGLGDPINANVPGTYDGTINHPDPADGSMKETAMTIGGQSVNAAAPWAALAPWLSKTQFWHIMSNTPVHPREGDVLSLLNTTASNEMLPSLICKQVAPCLGTIQAQPITVGATTPSEGLRFNGQALPIIPPLALKDTLTDPSGPLMTLQSMRDSTLAQLSSIYGATATKAQKAYLEALLTSQQQVRSINQALLAQLNSITDNTVGSQITAAITLIQMQVTPVIAIHIPFGGDNHSDPLLATEGLQTAGLTAQGKTAVTGVPAIVQLLQALDANNDMSGNALSKSTSFMTLNVFGRTLVQTGTTGRQHNPNHQVSVVIGTPFQSKIIGGVVSLGTTAKDYSCLPLDSTSGAGTTSGDVKTTDTLASFGKTMLAAVGVDSDTIASSVNGGTVIAGALA